MPLPFPEPAVEVQNSSGSDKNLDWYFAFFVISGFCGLVYEVVWIRLAMAQFGVNTALVSIVLSVFMAGLGLGSWGVRFIHRTGLPSPAHSLRLYAAVELAIGLSALFVPFELHFGRQLLLHWRGFGAWQSSGYFVLAGCVAALALMPWCTCMGATFPLLMAVIRRTGSSVSKSSFSYLYLANVLGALLGTLGSAFILIELLGFRHTLFVAGGLNALIAALAMHLSTKQSGSASENSTTYRDEKVDRPQPLYGLPQSTALWLLFASGLVSMGLEVVWIRQLTPYLGTEVYAFAGILAAYLLGTILGSRDYRRWALSHSLGESRTSWTLLATAAVLPLIAADPWLPYIHSSIVGLRVLGIVPYCALAGFLTPLLVDSWSAGDPDRAGTAYAANIAGCIVGPLIASFLLLPAMGERWALVTLCIPLFGIAGWLSLRALGAREQRKGSSRPLFGFIAALLAVAVLLRQTHDFEALFKAPQVRRDYSATVVAAEYHAEKRLLVNGVGMTSLTPITKYIAHLPLALAPSKPRNGLVICFGMGTSFRSMVSWGIPTTAVDLIPSVPAVFGYFHADAERIESLPNAHIVIDDGRRFLDGSTETFDVIVVDPPPPVPAAGSSLLYSREFYQVIKRHLRPHGILQAWYPEGYGESATTASITKAITESFPYVRAFRSYDGRFGIHFLASMETIQVPSSEVLASRMPSAAASDFVEWGPARDPKTQFDLALSRELSLGQLIAESPNTPALADDQPVNEYYILRSWFGIDR